MAAKSQLAALDVTWRIQAAVWSFSDEQAAKGLAFADDLRALFLPPPAVASSARLQPPTLLQLLPTELLSIVLSHLDTYDLARLVATCRLLWRDAPTPPPRPMPLLRPMGPVETELRRRATARGLCIVLSLPKGALSWVPYLLNRVLCEALRREAPLAVGDHFSVFVDEGGYLQTCGCKNSDNTMEGIHVLGHAVDPDANPDDERAIGLPTLVPSMQDRRIVSVAASQWHCLALSCEGEVYSWGNGDFGSLGYFGGGAREVLNWIELLSCVESIVVGFFVVDLFFMSVAFDADGILFTWGQATDDEDEPDSSSLGYARDSQTESQLTPKWVEALSEDSVVGVALGCGFTLAVTDAGAVFSFGYGKRGALGHGLLEAEVLPRRIEALTLTGRRFVAVAAGASHALALTEEGELYGWGMGGANSHGWDEPTPQRVTALIGQPVKHVDACDCISCAVTEKGEIYTWGNSEFGQLGHGDDSAQHTPKRVEGLDGVKVATAVVCCTHT